MKNKYLESNAILKFITSFMQNNLYTPYDISSNNFSTPQKTVQKKRNKSTCVTSNNVQIIHMISWSSAFKLKRNEPNVNETESENTICSSDFRWLIYAKRVDSFNFSDTWQFELGPSSKQSL